MAVIMMPVDYLVPHPQNPRKDLGDLTELAESIKANGIYQNLTVMPLNENVPGEDIKYMVLIGHRRLAAAKLAGLKEVPCSVVRDKSAKEQMSIMLVENMQRNDLSIYEQAQGFQQLLDFGMDVEDIASKSGFSQTTVRRRLEIAKLDQGKLKEVSEGRQLSLTDFDTLAKVEDIDCRNRLLCDIGMPNFKYKVQSAIQEQAQKKAMPEFKAEMRKRGITALKESERWGNKYERYYKVKKEVSVFDWDATKQYIPDNADKKLYYYICYGKVEFYTERKKAKAIKKTEAEIAYEKKVAAAWGKARMIAETHYKLRKAYIDKISVNKRLNIVLEGGLMAALVSEFDYQTIGTDAVVAALGDDDKALERSVRIATTFKFFDSAPSAEQLKNLVYNMFDDSANNNFLEGYTGNYPMHGKNYRLQALYKWLEQLGYERSEDEELMMTGKHEVFRQNIFDNQQA